MQFFPGDVFARAETAGSQLELAWHFGTEEQSYSPTTSMPPDVHQASEMRNSGANENICFGSIVDVKVQLCSIDGFSRYSLCSQDSAQSFTVVQEGDYFALEYGKYKFARLSKGLCCNLRALVTERQVCIRAFVPNKDWTTAVRSWSNQTPKLLPVDINVYGSREDAEEVGRTLSKSGTFLQFPRYGLDGAKYYNPHLFRIEGYPEQVPIETVHWPAEGVIPDRSVEEETQLNDSLVVDSILDSLSHHVPLREIPVDSRIKSTLLPHQKEAIDFIFEREISLVPSELSLWKYNDVDAEKPFYQHVFSGAKRPRQEEAKGGIIADEMGLGKSLVILSIIASSLDRADDFMAAESRLLSTQVLRKAHSRATLILAPSSLLIDSWIDEIHKHTYPGGLSFHKHLGPGRHAETHLLHERMIVFTTYATVATEFCRGNNPLAKVNWFRIVLDEAHDIRNRSTKQFQAVSSLSAQHRWCLTGTPIQNNLEDLGSLVAFLKVPILENAPTFRKFIISPITSTSRARFHNLRTLLRTVCLRRTRELLDLPEPIPQIRRLPLTPRERVEYDDLLLQCRREIDMVVSGRKKRMINSTVLESLLKLRLFCNNGNTNTVLCTGPTSLPADPDEALTYLQQYDQNVCAYCSGTIYSISDKAEAGDGTFISSCCHLVCHSCMFCYHAQKEGCPSCASGNEPTFPPISSSNHPQIQSSGRSENAGGLYHGQYPSKLLALFSDISGHPTHKSIVFSCWKKTLGLVGKLLDSHAVRYDMIDGSLSLAERIKVLKDFRSTSGANILLMTLGTGAVGLNLAVASRIYLLEPQWNPSIESQAIGRALRLGQTTQVIIVRYIMKHTVEESNVLSRQRRKLQLAGGGFGKEKDSSERLQSLLDVFGINWASVSR